MRKRYTPLKRLFTILLCVALLTGLFPVTAQAATTASGIPNEKTIYEYLVSEDGLHLCPAAAVGILANLVSESSFNPKAVNASSGAYGICQWYKDRYTNLVSFASTYYGDTDLTYKDLEVQLAFMKYELENVSYYNKYVYQKLQALSNNAEGAYWAAYYWCYYYEVPENYKTTAVTRGNTAVKKYWPFYEDDAEVEAYSESALNIFGYSCPTTLTQGSSFIVKGIITSATAISDVSVTVLDESGTKHIGASAALTDGKTYYCLSYLDDAILFGTLDAGTYTYKVTATDSSGKSTLLKETFTVTGSSSEEKETTDTTTEESTSTSSGSLSLVTTKTVADGSYYYIRSAADTSLCLWAKSGAKTDGTAMVLAAKTNNKYKKFKFIYAGDGWYYIKDVGSGKYVSVENNASSAGAKVVQTTKSAACTWQVLPDADGTYAFVPSCATDTQLCISTAADGSQAKIETASTASTSRWTLTKAYKAATITGATTPTTLKVGSGFTIKGSIKSTTKITSVTVAVYDADNNKVLSKTVKPNKKTYSLSKLDASVKFGTLSKGTYTYKVTATNRWGTKTLVSAGFQVTK